MFQFLICETSWWEGGVTVNSHLIIDHFWPIPTTITFTVLDSKIISPCKRQMACVHLSQFVFFKYISCIRQDLFFVLFSDRSSLWKGRLLRSPSYGSKKEKDILAENIIQSWYSEILQCNSETKISLNLMRKVGCVWLSHYNKLFFVEKTLSVAGNQCNKTT